MMLRTLPARSGFLWVLLACIFLAGCTRHPKYSLQTEAVLERLDAELSRKDRYQQWRQAQNDSLRREVARARNAGDRAWRLFAVSQNYVTYQLDSAAYYVDRLYRLAASAGSEDIRRIALLADIDVWLGRGQLGLAEELFRRIDTAGMSSAEYAAWHSRYSSIAARRAAEAEDGAVRSAWRDTVVRVRHISVPGQSEWTQARTAAAALRDSGRFAEAVQLLEP